MKAEAQDSHSTISQSFSLESGIWFEILLSVAIIGLRSRSSENYGN